MCELGAPLSSLQFFPLPPCSSLSRMVFLLTLAAEIPSTYGQSLECGVGELKAHGVISIHNEDLLNQGIKASPLPESIEDVKAKRSPVMSLRKKKKPPHVVDGVRALRWRLFVNSPMAYEKLMQACTGVHV